MPLHDAPCADEIDERLALLADKRVAVAMSGGVDSAVAAYRLKSFGAKPVGLALRLHDPDPNNPLAPRACCPPEDLQDARRVAEQIGFPFYVVDARSAFETLVVEPFVRSYLDGRTPNPCVACNSSVKLSRLVTQAKALGCVALATGHYARSRNDLGTPRLFTGLDAGKDQSYFLFAVKPEELAFLVFPLGALSKGEVRDLALSQALIVTHKLESQEVCFVGGAGAGDFVMGQPEASGDHEGPIVSTQGDVIGRHPGVMHYTIGQRRGIGVSAGERLHVLAIDAKTKTITVGSAEQLEKTGLYGGRATWVSGQPPVHPEVVAKIRYRDPGTPGELRVEGSNVFVRFESPVRAVAPGQAVVFYSGEEVLGGAWIEEATM